MTEQELINALNDTEAERVRWMTAALTAGNEVAALKEANETRRKQWASERYEVEQLKAQVNCLREAALDAISFMVGGEAKAKLRDAYDATPEQCLAKVKAKAIEEYKQEQAEMKQMELATRLMVSSI